MRPLGGVTRDDSPLSLIGSTPLVRIRRLALPESRLYAKCEQQNPGGSVKDRAIRWLLERAEAVGAIAPERTTIVDTTAGNFGLSLALVTALMRYRLHLVVARTTSKQRVALLRAYGAKVEMADDPDARARELTRPSGDDARETTFLLGARGAVKAAAYQDMADEIITQLGAVPDAIVAGVGSGATLNGLYDVFTRRSDGACRAVAVVQERGETRAILGIATDAPVFSDVRAVSHADALAMKLELARREALLVGMSAGAAVHVAREVAGALGPDKSVVVVLADTGERYFFEGE